MKKVSLVHFTIKILSYCHVYWRHNALCVQGGRAEDLLLEQQLSPGCVLGLVSGLLVSGQPGKQLAVLHPRSLHNKQC